jgi:drug/metabolite transporter (DMT)-like permease
VAILLAFLAIYLVWGSTFLAVEFAIETIPPLLMSGSRFAAAGVLLAAWCARRGRFPRPVWREDLVSGLLLIGVSYALVTWGQLRVSSGVAAIIISSIPAWIVVGEKLVLGRQPSGTTMLGVLIGFLGQGILIAPQLRDASATGLALGAIVLSNVSWTAGTLIITREHARDRDPFESAAFQMLFGGVMLLIGSTLLGEQREFDLAAVPVRSLASWAYLVVAGSLLGYSAYVWLLTQVSPTRVATHTFVNPIVAVLLGWWLANETVTWRTVAAIACVVIALRLILFSRCAAPR